MPTSWLTNAADVSFNSLLLLERVQLGWLPSWRLPESEVALALNANPAVDWYMRHKAPEIADWLNCVLERGSGVDEASPERTREAEIRVIRALDDLLVYALEPAVYDAQPFLAWDSCELLSVVDFAGKTVIDVGAGTGRLALAAAQEGASAVFAVEPVEKLRHYLRTKARALGLQSVFAMDGLITEIPFPAEFADITVAGHVFGDDPEAECAELERVTRPGGMVILCPGNNETDNDAHRYLVERGYEWSRFEEPEDGMKRKYWKRR